MQNRAAVTAGLTVLILAVVLFAIFGFGGTDNVTLPTGSSDTQNPNAEVAEGDLVAASVADNDANEVVRDAVQDERARTGVRGIVVDAKTGQPLGGIEVVAVKDQPSLAPLVDRFRGLFQQGMFVDTRAPRRELGRTVSNPDGTFELTGLPPGRLFLDGVSDGWFVRTPASPRIAVGQIKEGVELRASPGGRLRGIVLGADGAPSPGANVSVRPGLNAFLAQLTDRQYRWLDTVADENGRFDIPGVPEGAGYTVSATAPSIALEEVHGVGIKAGEVTTLTIQGHQGARISGRVLDPSGEPMPNASIAMIYLDISRVLFSADGRAEPIITNEEGYFELEHVGAGRVAVVAAATDVAPSNIVELAVVDGGVYDDLLLELGEGTAVAGMVVDDEDNPVAGAAVEMRPFERPNDPQFMKMMLKVRRVETTTDINGRFVVKGMTGEQIVIQASKAGYTTAIASGYGLDDEDIIVKVQRGVTIRGTVMAGEDAVKRFRVEARTREIPKDKDGNVIAVDASSGSNGRRWGRDRDNGGGPPWASRLTKRTRQLPEGQTMGGRGMDGNWREIQAVDGKFTLTGIPPGRVRIRVRAEGYLEPETQTIDLGPAASSEELVFEMVGGQPVSGRIVDEAGAPVSDAQVTAYKKKDDSEDGGSSRMSFNFSIDPEDFDFLAMSTSRRSAMSSSKGEFTIAALEPGEYRFTARHPDMAKSSTKNVIVKAGLDTPIVEIAIDAGGAVEGTVTGLAMRPLSDAFMVALSLQAGSMRSGTTDKNGYYKIEGLPPGQYVVFKSRMDERADNIGLELMSNMRMKTVTVRRGKVVRLDVHDEGEDGVRVFGTVRENGVPVPRALITVMGSDREGLLGMGVRANAANMEGRYELVGIKPGDYVMQVTRFQGQPVQTTFEVEVPEEMSDYAFDIDLPTSTITGKVIDTRGNPVKDVRVTLGSEDSGLSGADGLIGMIAANGLSQASTNDEGEFTMKSVAAGTYRLTAGSRMGGRGRGRRRDADEPQYGEASVDDVIIDGVSPRGDIVIQVPLAGKITGIVLDGSNMPVANAEIAFSSEEQSKGRKRGNPLLDLMSSQQPVRTGDDGRFEIPGMTPGTYSLSVESEALKAGKLDDVMVQEDLPTEVTLHVVTGATLRVRATNVSKKQIPFGNISLLDGRGKPVVSRVSTFQVMKRLMSSRDDVEDSGWYTFGSVPPDTYTAVLREDGQPDIRITRTIRDGEKVEWDIDLEAELAARERDKEKKK
ncbi:MAG: protocatechuate 3,4-dioxygenase beta subunit [Planctomycetota bacterium]|jgi:protocatechuate 3,4-dioxygenase beta subunit